MGKKTNKAIIAKKRNGQKKRMERKKAFIRKLIFKSFADMKPIESKPTIEFFPDTFEFILANEKAALNELKAILFRKFR